LPPVFAAEVFTTSHILVTAAIAGVLALAAAFLIAGRRAEALADSIVLGVLTAAAVFLWRKSANLPQLNRDGLQGFSANDWLAPTLTFVWLAVYRNLRPPREPRTYDRSMAAATIIALAVNVITI
jgi:hypothetical protein